MYLEYLHKIFACKYIKLLNVLKAIYTASTTYI